MNDRFHVFRKRSWEPTVTITNDCLIYELCIAIMHYDKHFRFKISDQEFEVLKSDERRRYFLFGVLHTLYALRPETQDLSQDPHISKVLLGDTDDVDAFLTRMDQASRFEISKLAAEYLQRDSKEFTRGNWF